MTTHAEPEKVRPEIFRLGRTDLLKTMGIDFAPPGFFIVWHNDWYHTVLKEKELIRIRYQ